MTNTLTLTHRNLPPDVASLFLMIYFFFNVVNDQHIFVLITHFCRSLTHRNFQPDVANLFLIRFWIDLNHRSFAGFMLKQGAFFFKAVADWSIFALLAHFPNRYQHITIYHLMLLVYFWQNCKLANTIYLRVQCSCWLTRFCTTCTFFVGH